MSIKYRKNVVLFVAIMCMFFSIRVTVSAEDIPRYEVGCGISDITGPPAEIVMMGYADSKQSNRGLHMRLRSRAVAIKDTESNKQVVFVSTDTGMVFQSVKQGVIEKLQELGFGEIYDESNVMISAIHTHSGPAGYAHHGLYNVSCYGFIEENYEVIVQGITESIIEAHNNLEPGYIEVSEGECTGTSANRSPEAYLNNPEEERAKYNNDVDETMTVLSFRNLNDELLGVFNWFAVHPVSMGVQNKLVSSDNKGTASYLFEKEMGTDYSKNRTFIAAFAQANAGDVTPNIFGGDQGYGDNDFESTLEAARIQLDACKNIMTNGTEIQGGLDYRYETIDMSSLVIRPEFGEGEERYTYAGAMGYSFAAGTEDYRGGLYPFFHEGMTQEEYPIEKSENFNAAFIEILRLAPKFYQLNGNKYPEMWQEQYPKPILFATSKADPDPWTPQIVPLQVFKIGEVTIAAFPCEVTTMAGRRTREIIKAKLDNMTGEDNKVIISTLANSYTSYLTTPEEYDMQHYEGASTQFGKWTLNGYLQELDKLVGAIIDGEEIERGPEMSDLRDEQVTFEVGVIYDSTPPGKEFGEVYEDVDDQYTSGDTVKVSFWAGHPNNNFRTDSTYLKVQKKVEGEWVTVANDWDWETVFRWKRRSVVAGTSLAKIEWTIPENAEPGIYRIVHQGTRKKIFNRYEDYIGYSKEFLVYN